MEEILNAEVLGESVFENDLDDAVVLHVFQNEHLGNRAELYGRFNLQNISDSEAKNLFRFEKAHIPRLAAALGIPENITTGENIRLPGVNDLEIIFGYSYGALSSIINTVMALITNNKSYLVENLRNLVWLNEAKLQQYSQCLQKEAPMNNCWAFIDGTVRPICRPTENQVHCVKYQSLLCPDGIIASIKGAYPGRRHDSGIFRESGLYEELEQFTVFEGRNYVIFGDQGYSLRQLLIRPYSEREVQGNLARQNFNTVMSSLRVAVEWGFQKIIQEFAFLDFKKDQKLMLQEIGTMYVTGVILINCHTCLYGSQTSTYFNIQPPQLEEYLNNYVYIYLI